MTTLSTDQRLIVLFLQLMLFYRPSGLAVFFGAARLPQRQELVELILQASRPEEQQTGIAVARAKRFELLLEEYGSLPRWRQLFRRCSEEGIDGIDMLRLWPELKRNRHRIMDQESILPSNVAGFTATTLDGPMWPDRRRAAAAIEKIARMIYEYTPEYA